jgi:hypothetical protein
MPRHHRYDSITKVHGIGMFEILTKSQRLINVWEAPAWGKISDYIIRHARRSRGRAHLSHRDQPAFIPSGEPKY